MKESHTVPHGTITLNELAATLGKKPHNLKRDLQLLAVRNPDFKLSEWAVDLPDSSGRMRQTYAIPEKEALLVAATYGYKYAKAIIASGVGVVVSPELSKMAAKIKTLEFCLQEEIAAHLRVQVIRQAFAKQYADLDARADFEHQIVVKLKAEVPELHSKLEKWVSDSMLVRPRLHEQDLLDIVPANLNGKLEELVEQAKDHLHSVVLPEAVRQSKEECSAELASMQSIEDWLTVARAEEVKDNEWHRKVFTYLSENTFLRLHPEVQAVLIQNISAMHLGYIGQHPRSFKS